MKKNPKLVKVVQVFPDSLFVCPCTTVQLMLIRPCGECLPNELGLFNIKANLVAVFGRGCKMLFQFIICNLGCFLGNVQGAALPATTGGPAERRRIPGARVLPRGQPAARDQVVLRQREYFQALFSVLNSIRCLE